MATKTVVLLTDDITGEPIPQGQGQTIEFAVDGVAYTIDLSNASARAFRETLDHYVQHAQRLGRTGSAPRRPVPVSVTPVGVDPMAVRAWARSNGITVNPRGRIAASIIDQYRAAGH